MYHLKTPCQSEIEIKKSRFIAYVEPVANRAEAMQRLAELRRQYPDARHHCWVLLSETDSGLDDDGEPGGTAAKPMYNVLMHRKLTNVLAVVVRYFGGIKLGAGGLVRAYSQAVSEALADAELVAVVRSKTLWFGVPFALESALRRWCEQQGVPILEVDYGEAVRLRVRLPEDSADAQCAALADSLHGALTVVADD
ncbi:YigZ family protein [Crenobacter sp. SG2303]|uniref:YigZ family protein n=1 Tax=Crenobacter oryzisoli TaxID=3056844 RepID=A0ABT7XP39_9NEIS|nr:YigZ family protein [Crenobacter sp. SG2303]MDN0075553.1 YigZ family protein [Crenobacter sp. SG2303]